MQHRDLRDVRLPTDNGVATFTLAFKTAGSHYLRVVDTSNSLIASTVRGIVVQPAAASVLVVRGFPRTTLANVAGTFSVTAEDRYGNVTPSFSDTVQFSSSDGQAVLPGPYTFQPGDKGRQSFSATFKSYGPQTLLVSDASLGISGVENIKVVRPSAGISGPGTVVRGQDVTFTLHAHEPLLPRSTVFTYQIDWNGDGTDIQTLTGTDGLTLDHMYVNAGSNKIRVTVTDPYGNASLVATHGISVRAAALEPDPSDATKKALFVGGTTGSDTILLSPTNASGTIRVTINGISQGVFAPTGHLIVFGQDGNDTIRLASRVINGVTVSIAAPALFVDGTGNDVLDASGSRASNVLVGGGGSDVLQGGSGRDLLIGGAGGSILRGSTDAGILIGGTTDYDSNLPALLAILAEWSRPDSEADFYIRIGHLNGSLSGGLNGPYDFTTATVHDNGVVDQLFGSSGRDWFLYKDGQDQVTPTPGTAAEELIYDTVVKS
jgi:hypothetical protein